MNTEKLEKEREENFIFTQNENGKIHLFNVCARTKQRNERINEFILSWREQHKKIYLWIQKDAKIYKR